MCFHFSYTKRVDTVYQKVLYTQLVPVFMLRSLKNKKAYSEQVRLHCFTQKRNFCIMNKIKLV